MISFAVSPVDVERLWAFRGRVAFHRGLLRNFTFAVAVVTTFSPSLKIVGQSACFLFFLLLLFLCMYVCSCFCFVLFLMFILPLLSFRPSPLLGSLEGGKGVTVLAVWPPGRRASGSRSRAGSNLLDLPNLFEPGRFEPAEPGRFKPAG